ncbi:MAG: hypothetical protein JW963_07305 [Anaerolineales bacterium]|nr:hypothetical protein [Anaerolineales bacterium]
MNKFPVFAIVALIAATLACQAVFPNRTVSETPDLGCHEAITAVNELRSGLTFPQYFSQENPAKQGGEFDPNRYFEAFTHLQMQDGYVLDYVYHQDGMGGYPLLYARPVDQAPYVNETEYAAAPGQPDYLAFVIPQDSPEGYFEFAAFAMLANQFYLDWHANYNDWQVLCSQDEVESIIQDHSGQDTFGIPMTAAQKRGARAIKDPQPSVELTAETATVKILVFTDWGGFYRRTMTIRRADHFILDEQDEPLVEYDCGIMF